MSSNRKNVNKKIIKKNVRSQHFCLKMRALEKWCVTKVAHCILASWLSRNRYNLTKSVKVDCMACTFGKEFGRKLCSSERALKLIICYFGMTNTSILCQKFPSKTANKFFFSFIYLFVCLILVLHFTDLC